MDKLKLKTVEDAEHCLFLMLVWIKDTEQKLVTASDTEQRKKIITELDEGRIRFSQMMADVIIYKARYGIFTLPKLPK